MPGLQTMRRFPIAGTVLSTRSVARLPDFTKIRARGNEVPAQLMKGYYDGEPSFRSNRGDHARYGAMNGLTFVEWAGQFLVLTLKRRDRCPRLHSASSSDFVALLTKAIHRSQD